MEYVKQIEKSVGKLKTKVEQLESFNQQLKLTLLDLLSEPSISKLDNYSTLELKYKQRLKLLLSEKDQQPKAKSKEIVNVKYIDSIYSPKWAKSTKDTYNKKLYEQKETAKKAINISKKSVEVKAKPKVKTIEELVIVNTEIDPKDEIISKIDIEGKTYLSYNEDLFDEEGKHVGSITDRITINDKEIPINNQIINLVEVEDGYYKDSIGGLYKLSSGLAKKVGNLNGDEMEVFE